VFSRKRGNHEHQTSSDLNNIVQAWFWALDLVQLSLIDCTLETLTVFCYHYSRGNEGNGLFKAARQKLIAGKDDRLLGHLLARYAWIKSKYGIDAD
jgi:hypothetical protein